MRIYEKPLMTITIWKAYKVLEMLKLLTVLVRIE